MESKTDTTYLKHFPTVKEASIYRIKKFLELFIRGNRELWLENYQHMKRINKYFVTTQL